MLRIVEELVVVWPSGLVTVTVRCPLAAPEANGAARLDAARVKALLEFTSRHFQYVVVDVPG